MQRSLFDSAGRPERHRQPEQERPAGPHIYTVSELNTEFKLLLESTYRSVWVQGEISNFSQPASGHFYFCLKDAESQIKAVMWKSNHRVLKWRPKNGMKVMISGRVSVYEPRGEYQIDIQQIVPHGKGDLFAAFEQLKEKLEAEGLFNPARKRPIPMLPRKIGIVTSRTGAAIRDILQILNRRYANLRILLYPAIVQGEEAAASIVDGIRVMNRRSDIDVLIVGRGGGSLEDLWPFNEEIVARAIVASRIPVISAVGHESDTTISDYVADLRASTPSAAAELVVAKKSELADRLQHMQKRIHTEIRSRLLLFRHAARGLAEHRAIADLPQRVHTYQQTVDDFELRIRGSLERLQQQQVRRHLVARQQLSPGQLRHLIELKRSALNQNSVALRQSLRIVQQQYANRNTAAAQKLNGAPLRQMIAGQFGRVEGLLSRLARAVAGQIGRGKEAFANRAGKLDSLSPLAVLERGYSIASLEEGPILKDSAQAKAGDHIQVRLHRGRLKCRVTEVEDE